MLTSIFTPADCATCKLCCNFHRSSAWETPSLDEELVYLLQEECVPLEKRPDGSTSFFLNFCTENEDEVANCPMLDTSTGCTLPREVRPFECRIWPLRLMKKYSTLVIGVYKNCPALKDETLDKLVEYTQGELLPMLLDYAHRHPACIRPYNDAYTIIWKEK